jgi:hypothetical protein
VSSYGSLTADHRTVVREKVVEGDRSASCRTLADTELDARLETGRYLDALADVSAAPAAVRPLRAAEAP